MNVLKQKIKYQKRILLYKCIAIAAFILSILLESRLLYTKLNNDNSRSAYIEDQMSFSETQQNKIISENSLLMKADAMYYNLLLNKNQTIESYISDLKQVIQSTSNYYGLFNPLKITVSYDNAVVGATALVPVNISISMRSIFDYTPMRVIFILFNNTLGTINCNGLSINREYSVSNMFNQVSKKGYLFNSEINLRWFIMFKPLKPRFQQTFSIYYKKVEDLERIEHMYNMSTWNESFMIFPEDIEKLKEIQRSMR